MKAKIYRISRGAAQQLAQHRLDVGQVALALRYGNATRQSDGITRFTLAGIWVTTQANQVVAVGRVTTTRNQEPE